MNTQRRPARLTQKDKTPRSLLDSLLETVPISKPSKEAKTELTYDQQHASEELMAEYDQLRKEILQNDNIMLQVLTVTLILTEVLQNCASAASGV